MIQPFINSGTIDPYARLGQDQITRLERMHNEPLYLIDVKCSDDGKYTFKVSGSSGNLYTVDINPEAKRSRDVAKCDCPDASIGAKFKKCHCKHACFVLIKACKMQPSILEEGPMRDTVLLKAGLHTIDQNRNWGGLTNTHYVSTYKRVICGQEDVPEDGVVPFDIPNDYELTDACSICLDDQTNDKKEDSAMCMKCKNCFHRECIGQWLRARRTACPLCRGSWSGYIKKNKATAHESGDYFNLVKEDNVVA